MGHHPFRARLNSEINLLAVIREIAAAREALFERDFAATTQARHDEIGQRNFRFQLGARGARLLSLIL